ncbi:MAG TPA: VCBS repeat-containing protein, partial [Planctomycetota bacterium]|nr:VCBS repeat-containing protein [Planctomycetota bacterium]
CKPAEQAEVRKLLILNGPAPVVFFVAGTKGYLHAGGQWLAVKPNAAGPWEVTSLASRLSGTWSGGTDMLIRLSEHVLAEPDVVVPASVGMTWMDTQAELGTLDGTPHALDAVTLPDGELYVFAALDTGDRLFRATRNDETFEEVTAKVKLTTRSKRFAWTDLDGDGRIDLVSWDGREVTLWRLSNAGTFERAEQGKGFALDECVGLAPCAMHANGVPALVVSTTSFPFLLTRSAAGTWVKTDLPPRVKHREPPTCCACIVADLDGDGWWDVLQPRPGRAFLWRGSAAGLKDFEVTDVAAAGETCRFALGDFNHDGSLDLFLADEKSAALWENDGTGKFRDVTTSAGSLGYKLPLGVSDCIATDLNHDGRTDLALFYAKGALNYHFNRGFRCFGEEGELRLAGGDRGQAAAAVGDFNADGSLDLVVALTPEPASRPDGTRGPGGRQVGAKLRCYYNAAFEKPVVRVSLPKGSVGPVTVSVWQGEKHPVAAGTFPVCAAPLARTFTLGSAKPFVVKWHPAPGPGQAGKPETSKRVTLPEALPDRGFEILLDR